MCTCVQPPLLHVIVIVVSTPSAPTETIKTDSIELSKIEIEENNLFESILEIRKGKQNAAIQIIKLGRIQMRIDQLKEQINLMNEWILESSEKLIIC